MAAPEFTAEDLVGELEAAHRDVSAAREFEGQGSVADAIASAISYIEFYHGRGDKDNANIAA